MPTRYIIALSLLLTIELTSTALAKYPVVIKGYVYPEPHNPGVQMIIPPARSQEQVRIQKLEEQNSAMTSRMYWLESQDRQINDNLEAIRQSLQQEEEENAQQEEHPVAYGYAPSLGYLPTGPFFNNADGFFRDGFHDRFFPIQRRRGRFVTPPGHLANPQPFVQPGQLPFPGPPGAPGQIPFPGQPAILAGQAIGPGRFHPGFGHASSFGFGFGGHR